MGGKQIQRGPWQRQDCGSGYQKRFWLSPWIRRVGSEIHGTEINLLISSPKTFYPGYEATSGKRGWRFEEWILPAFGIPIRNPAVANEKSG
jgi:hypothetical protein